MAVCEVKNCFRCDVPGKVVKSQSSGVTKYKCPKCGQVWSSLDINRAVRKAATYFSTPPCLVCGKPSGYPGGGICKKCYQAGNRQA